MLFFIFLIIALYFLTHAVIAQISITIAGLAIPKGIMTNEENA